jgi:hypothetical protein
MNSPSYYDGPSETDMYVRVGGRFWWLFEAFACLLGAVLVAAFEVTDGVRWLVRKVRRG